MQSIAISGAWGYIGRKFLDAALDIGLDVHAYDPGPVPADIDLDRVNRVESEAEFYALDVDLYHLALHPNHRDTALDALLPRASADGIVILNEKPMAAPEHPELCRDLVARIHESGALVLFDFPELFDTITHRVVEFLSQFDQVAIDSVFIQRSKDREDRGNPRNRKIMVPIQYQESVHCLAFVLHVLGRIRGSVGTVFEHGLSASAFAEPYDPPNPEDYPYVVDGRCDFDVQFGPTAAHGHTNFKRGAPFRKQRVLTGTGDGKPFTIDLDFLEEHKTLRINNVDQDCDPGASSYAAVLNQLGEWTSSLDKDTLMSGVYPNPSFARYTYQLSSLLWRASREASTLQVAAASDLLAFDAHFAETIPTFPTYS